MNQCNSSQEVWAAQLAALRARSQAWVVKMGFGTTEATAGEGTGGAPSSEVGTETEGPKTTGKSLSLQPIVVAADRRSFERILLQPDMFTDHLPDSYLAVVKQL